MFSGRCCLGLWLFLVWQLAIGETAAYIDVPKLSRPVTDLTATLNDAQVNALESKLSAFETQKGSQIAILILPSTQPETIEEYGIKVLDLWRIGRKGVDDGLIFLIAKNDRKLRIEVGYGLEGVIPDAVAKRIISETVTPLFKAGDFVGGINAGVDHMISLIEGEQLPAPIQSANSKQQNEGGFVFTLFGGLFAGSLLSSMFGRVVGGLIAGVGSVAIASVFIGFGIGAIAVGIIVFFLIAARSGGGGGGYYGGGGYGGGSWGGGTGGSLGGGSWSGGGGSGGGGGASGSW